jgi:hypothetical protein
VRRDIQNIVGKHGSSCRHCSKWFRGTYLTPNFVTRVAKGALISPKERDGDLIGSGDGSVTESQVTGSIG